MRILSLLSVFFALILAAAAPPAAAHGPKQVPFQGVDTFAPASGGSITCSGTGFFVLPRVSQSHGRFSHLGKTTGIFTVGSCEATAEGSVFVHGLGIETATNGDQLFITYGLISINTTTGALTASAEITGGTGRFADAAGSASAVGTFIIPEGTTYTLRGTISTVGSNK